MCVQSYCRGRCHVVDDRMLNLAKLMDVAQLRAEVHAGNLANANTRVTELERLLEYIHI